MCFLGISNVYNLVLFLKAGFMNRHNRIKVQNIIKIALHIFFKLSHIGLDIYFFSYLG